MLGNLPKELSGLKLYLGLIQANTQFLELLATKAILESSGKFALVAIKESFHELLM